MKGFNQLGSRLGIDVQPAKAATFGRRDSSRLQAAYDTEVQSMTQGMDASMQQAMGKAKEEITGEEGISHSEAPWKGPLDPEGEVY